MELYHFGMFRLDVAERRLWCNDEPISISPKQFELLFYFVENAGRVTTKNELLDAVWANTYVEESTLARNISWLRKELRSHSNGKRFIETVPKLGYRFAAEVTRPENNGNAIIIEEQTVQHFRGEETITIDDTAVEKPGEREKGRWEDDGNKIVALSNISPSPYLPISLSPLLLAAFAFVAFAGISITLYQNNPKTAVRTADLNVKANITVKNITVDAIQETVDTGIKVQKGDTIDVSADGEYQHGKDQTWTYEGDKNAKVSTDYTFQKADPLSLVGWIGTETDQNNYFQVSKINSITADKNGSLYFAVNERKNKYADNRGGLIVTVTLTRPAVTGSDQIKIGSIVHLQNQYPDDGGYLDAWGLVKDKPEFSIVPTEIMFVSTHPSPNRDNGSGSWKIVSATGKKKGEPLLFGDEIYLLNMHPDAGYLDNCGWIKDMPVFKDFVEVEKFAVFTAYSEDRDNGTGTWIVSSAAKFDGSPVLERDGIGLENGFPGGGYLDTAGRVSSIPAFSDYDGSLLVFIHELTTSRRANSGIWTISISKSALK